MPLQDRGTLAITQTVRDFTVDLENQHRYRRLEGIYA